MPCRETHFSQKLGLIKHPQEGMAAKAYTCIVKECGKIFFDKWALKTHTLKVHKVSLSNENLPSIYEFIGMKWQLASETTPKTEFDLLIVRNMLAAHQLLHSGSSYKGIKWTYINPNSLYKNKDLKSSPEPINEALALNSDVQLSLEASANSQAAPRTLQSATQTKSKSLKWKNIKPNSLKVLYNQDLKSYSPAITLSSDALVQLNLEAAANNSIT